MSGQLAKLFIRGSLINKTAKNLTNEQQIQVEKLMYDAWNDPNLDSAKIEFCSALRRTIGNEYCDRDLAAEEIWITFWRTAADILYHIPRIENFNNEQQYLAACERWENRKHKVTKDPIIRKKYFQTCMFNYLRQILNENKIPTCRYNKVISGPADVVAKELIIFILDNAVPKAIRYSLSESNTATFHLNTHLIPQKTIKKIWSLSDEFKDCGIEILLSEESIIIVSNNPKHVTKKVSDRMRVKAISMTGLKEDDTRNNYKDHCEYHAAKKMEAEVDKMLIKDAVETLSQRLNPQSKRILDILIDPPQEFLDEFYPQRKKAIRPKEKHIAQYLGISKTEVNKAIAIIQKQARALDIA